MKTYQKLEIPKTSAWGRKTWRTYTPIWLIKIIDGIHNIVRWIPVIYRDKDWDDFFITKLLQKKLEHQRKYLVKANRFVNIDQVNRDITIVLNLIERKHLEYYASEQYNYQQNEIVFNPVGDSSEYLEVSIKVKQENLDEYLAKYPGTVRRVLKQHLDLDSTDKQKLSFYVAKYNQEKNDRLLWKIMSERSSWWWD